jgi:hypothetical protein
MDRWAVGQKGHGCSVDGVRAIRMVKPAAQVPLVVQADDDLRG